MKYFLSIEFEDQGQLSKYKVGDIITFISLKGLLKNGIIKEIKTMTNHNDIPTEYKVDCNGKNFIAVADYVLKTNAKVLNLKSRMSELDEGFPLRT
jgi:uncharacterized protein YkvS